MKYVISFVISVLMIAGGALVCHFQTSIDTLELNVSDQNKNLTLEKGFSSIESWGVWACEKECQFKLRLPEFPTDVKLFMKLRSFSKDRTVRLMANGLPVARWNVVATRDAREYVALIPMRFTKKAVLFTIEQDEPISPSDIIPGNTDKRTLGVGLESLRVVPVDSERKSESMVLSFGTDSDLVNQVGLTDGRPEGLWTAEKAQFDINMPLGMCAEKVVCSLKGRMFLAGDKLKSQRIEIKADGVPLLSQAVDSPDLQTLSLDFTPMMTCDGVVRIELDLPDAASPKGLGVCEDPRRLGILLRECKLEMANSIR